MNPENDKRDGADSSTETDSSSSDTTSSESSSSAADPKGSASTDSSTEFKNTLDSPKEALTDEQLESLSKGRREDRRNWIQNVNLTLDYIGTVSRDKKLHFRSHDQLTSKLLIGSFVLALGFAALPFFEIYAVAAFAYVLADIMLFVAISVFVVSRFGIIRAMEPRHALVCWHLMVGTGLLALTIGFNVLAGVLLFMMRERLPLFFSGGG